MSVKPRPVFLEIPNIRLPIPGIVSILHRISGVGLFIMLPVLLYLLSGTLSRESAFETYRAIVSNRFGLICTIFSPVSVFYFWMHTKALS